MPADKACSPAQLVFIIARREFLEIFANRSLIAAGALFAGWFIVLHGVGIATKHGGDVLTHFNSTVLNQAALVSIFVGYIYSGQAFLFEKTEGIIETLMCAPITLRNLWLGKTIGIAFPSWCVCLIWTAAYTIIARHWADPTLLPSLPLVLNVLVLVPCITVAVVGLIGIWQLVLGMRENQIVNLVVFVLLFAAINFSDIFVKSGVLNEWGAIAVIFGISLVIGSSTLLLSRFLSRERIVRSIP